LISCYLLCLMFSATQGTKGIQINSKKSRSFELGEFGSSLSSTIYELCGLQQVFQPFLSSVSSSVKWSQAHSIWECRCKKEIRLSIMIYHTDR
jgi:hypothetical protein